MVPNILWLMADEQRRDSLGEYGSPWASTPHLDRLMHSGVRFDNAYTSAPVCQPARESILTGDYPAQTRVWKNLGFHALERHYLPRAFIEAGYRSATFGKQHYSGTERAFTYEENGAHSSAVDCYGYAPQYDEDQYGVIKYPGEYAPWVLGGTFPAPAEEKQESILINHAIAWLEEQPDDTPFLLRISFSAPHTPVVPPRPFDTLIPEDVIKLPVPGTLPDDSPAWLKEWAEGSGSHCLSAAEISKARQFYYGEVAFVDQQFGRLLDWMSARGMLDNTIIAYVSDHGTHIGDYGLVQKQTMFEPVVGVPYFFWYPQAIASGAVLSTPVETRSLVPTLLALAGLPVDEKYKGNNLAHSLIHGTEPNPKPVISEICTQINDIRYVMVRDADYKLILQVTPQHVFGDGILFDLQADPLERHNLFHNPAYESILSRLTALIKEHLKDTDMPFANVKICEPARFADRSKIACPSCNRTAMTRRVTVEQDIAWTEGLSQAYQCGHCGTRFGLPS